MIFLDRRRRGEDPHLDWKIRLFIVGAVIALLGMARDASWMLVVGILVLLAGAALRFFSPRVAEPPPWGEEGDEDASGFGDGPANEDGPTNEDHRAD